MKKPKLIKPEQKNVQKNKPNKPESTLEERVQAIIEKVLKEKGLIK
jgi:hypothetical protein